MTKHQYFEARKSGKLYAQCRALAFRVPRAQIELYELAYLADKSSKL